MKSRLRKKLSKVWKQNPDYQGTLVFGNVVIHKYYDHMGKHWGFPCAYRVETKLTVNRRRKRLLMRKAPSRLKHCKTYKTKRK